MNQSFQSPDLELMTRGRPADIPIRVQIVAPGAAPRTPRALRQRMIRSVWRRRGLVYALVPIFAILFTAAAWLNPRLNAARASIEVTPPASATAIAKRIIGRGLHERAAYQLNIPALPEYIRSGSARNFFRRLAGLSGVATSPSQEDFQSSLERNLRIATSAQDRVIDLEFRASDPPKAAAYLDLLAIEVERDHDEARAASVRQTREAYQSQVFRARSELDDSKEDLIAFARTAGIALDERTSGQASRWAIPPPSGEADRPQPRISAQRTENYLRLQAKENDFANKRTIYENLLRKAREAESDSLNVGSLHVLGPGRVVERPKGSGLVFAAVAGGVFGLLIALPLCLVLDAVSHAVRDAAELPALLGLTSLGVIPHVGHFGDPSVKGYGGVIDLNPAPDARPDAALFTAGGSSRHGSGVRTADLGEAFRQVLASLWIAGQSARRPRVLLFASPSAREGKTTIVANLGIALAHTHRRVLVIEADLRNPQLHEIFRVPAHWGLANLLEENEPVENYSFEDLAFTTDIPGLYILPAGHGELSIANMRHIDRLTELLMRCRLEFHAVLIDTPAALRYPDARIVARLCDAAVMVLRAGETSRDDASALSHQFDSDGTTVLGAVLNDCPVPL